MLIPTRKPGEALRIEPEGEASGESLFAEGKCRYRALRSAAQAPISPAGCLKILRAELEKKGRAQVAQLLEA